MLSLSAQVESFFEHEGQAVCAKCKHEAIAYAQPPAPYVVRKRCDGLAILSWLTEHFLGCSCSVVAAPIGVGVAGYRFDAQDETQLTIYPGDKVSILQKVRDGCSPLNRF